MSWREWKADLKKPCSSCPFRKDIPLVGAPEWAMDILKAFRAGRSLAHSCHRTDPKADGYKGTEKIQHCHGYDAFLENNDDPTTPNQGIWKSLEEMMMAYLCQYRDDGLLSADMAVALEARLKSDRKSPNAPLKE